MAPVRVLETVGARAPGRRSPAILARGLQRSIPARTFGLLLRAHRGLVIGWILAAIGHGALYPIVAYTSKEVADGIVAGSTADVVRWVLWELLFVGAAAALMRLMSEARALLRSRVRLGARQRIAEKAGELDLAQFDDPDVQDRIDSARTAADTRPLDLVHETLTVLRSVVGLLVFAALLSSFSLWALLFLLAVVPGALAELWSSRRSARAHDGRMRQKRRVRYLQDVVFSENLAAENRLNGVAPPLIATSHAAGRELFADERREWRRSVGVTIGCQLVPTLMVNVCYLLMAVATVRGRLTLGELTLYGMSLTMSQRLSQQLLLSARNVLGGWPHLRTLFAFLDQPVRARVQLRDAGSDARVELPPPGAAGLRLENVSFRYPGSDGWAVRNLELAIAPGDFVAIVGGNGSGKSTLLKLITGLVRPTEGKITLGGRELDRWDPGELKRRFAVVFQGFARYGLSVRDNVALGRASLDEDAASLATALRASGADEVAAQLVRGVDTELIPSLPDGAGLSGGQWQRIALARGLVRDEADYLVLDEPTSALDAAAEARILDHLRSLQARKAILLITHRSSQLRPTDRVVVLERGRLVADDGPSVPCHVSLDGAAEGA